MYRFIFTFIDINIQDDLWCLHVCKRVWLKPEEPLRKCSATACCRVLVVLGRDGLLGHRLCTRITLFSLTIRIIYVTRVNLEALIRSGVSILYMCWMCAVLQELEALRSQVQSQSTEIGQLKMERQDLLRRAEVGVKIMRRLIWHLLKLFKTNEPFSGFSQCSDTLPSSDSSLDAAKMAELESRLGAQTSEMERLKVRENMWSSKSLDPHLP